MKRIYLDWASSAPLLPAAAEAQKKSAYNFFGNPSSLPWEGREARAGLEEARAVIARAADALPEEVVFTSGATEANNLVVSSLLRKTLMAVGGNTRPRIVAGAVEHASFREPLLVLEKAGFEVVFVPPEPDGILSPDRLADAVNEETALVSLMLVNNETGARQRVGECAVLVREYARRHKRKIHFHTDAVQGFGKLWFSFRELGVDSVSLSAHKIGGPRGIGALLLRKQTPFDVLFPGGGQERNLRSGTENTGGIAGFAESVTVRLRALEANLAAAERLMQKMITALHAIDGVLVMPESREADDTTRYSPFILTVCVPPVPGEVLVRSLDDQGIALSTGSACHTGKKDATRVLEAQGVAREIAACALRVSFGPETTEADIDTFLGALAGVVPPLLKIARKKH